MKSTTVPSAPHLALKLEPENPAFTRRRHRELASEPPAGIRAWTPDEGDPS